MKLDDVYDDLLSIVSEVRAAVSTPIESERFFSDLLENYQGTRNGLLQYVQNNIRLWFRYIDDEPRWIQSPEWRFYNGKPMVFVGQIDISREKGQFHDDASFYIFWDSETGVVDTVIQVA